MNVCTRIIIGLLTITILLWVKGNLRQNPEQYSNIDDNVPINDSGVYNMFFQQFMNPYNYPLRKFYSSDLQVQL